MQARLSFAAAPGRRAHTPAPAIGRAVRSRRVLHATAGWDAATLVNGVALVTLGGAGAGKAIFSSGLKSDVHGLVKGQKASEERLLQGLKASEERLVAAAKASEERLVAAMKASEERVVMALRDVPLRQDRRDAEGRLRQERTEAQLRQGKALAALEGDLKGREQRLGKQVADVDQRQLAALVRTQAKVLELAGTAAMAAAALQDVSTQMVQQTNKLMELRSLQNYAQPAPRQPPKVRRVGGGGCRGPAALLPRGAHQTLGMKARALPCCTSGACTHHERHSICK